MFAVRRAYLGALALRSGAHTAIAPQSVAPHPLGVRREEYRTNETGRNRRRRVPARRTIDWSSAGGRFMRMTSTSKGVAARHFRALAARRHARLGAIELTAAARTPRRAGTPDRRRHRTIPGSRPSPHSVRHLARGFRRAAAQSRRRRALHDRTGIASGGNAARFAGGSGRHGGGGRTLAAAQGCRRAYRDRMGAVCPRLTRAAEAISPAGASPLGARSKQTSRSTPRSVTAQANRCGFSQKQCTWCGSTPASNA